MMECIYCSAKVESLEEMEEHHFDVHQDYRWDPVFYHSEEGPRRDHLPEEPPDKPRGYNIINPDPGRVFYTDENGKLRSRTAGE